MVDEKIKNILIDILVILTSVLILNTYTFLLRYYSGIRWIIVFLIVFCCVFGPKCFGFRFSKRLIKHNILWIVCTIYLWLGYIYSYDRASTVTYCIAFSSYILLLFVGKIKKYYKKLFDFLEKLLLICAISIYLNVIIPDLMTRFLRFLLSPIVVSAVESFVSRHIYTGFFGDNANAAFAMNIGFAIAFSNYINKKNNRYLIESVLFFGTLIFIGKRMLIITPVILICISALCIVKNKAIKRSIVGVLVLLLVIFCLSISVPSINRLFFRNSDDLLNSRATVLWPVAFFMFNSNHLFGTGINTFNYIIRFNNANDLTLAEWGNQAHNIYIQLLGETGIVGIVLFVTLWIVNLTRTVNLIKGNKSDKSILSKSLLLQVLWFVYGMTGNTFYYSAQLLVYIVAVGCMESIRNEKYKNSNLNIS